MSTNENETMTSSAVSSPDAAAAVVDRSAAKPLIDAKDMDFLNDVQIVLTIEVGRTQIKIRDLLNLSKDSIVELNKNAGEPVDIYANGKLISQGNIISSNGKYCVRLTSIAKNVAGSA